MAPPEQLPTASAPGSDLRAQRPASDLPGSDLHAQIQARIADRRNAARSDRLAKASQLSVSELKAAHSDAPSPDRADAGHIARRRRHAPPPAPTTHHLHRALRFVVLLVLTGVTVIGLRTFVIASYYIPSASMETTLHGCPGCEPDLVLVDKLSYRFKSIGRKDVVVFDRPPLAPPEDKQLIKRVIGLPGDVISGHGGHVFVNDKELVEPYVNPTCHGTADFAAVKVPAGSYFMMGDNRCDSFDSRMFGTIPRSSIVGRAFAVIWPVKHLRWL
ncbi:MAG TPA: signal peptidase I [Jatrophihabitans sp.]|nr:signal peptidase I [Jatrophihabitans sp.]